jgi:GNAT superfamily N-acetyltransferase
VEVGSIEATIRLATADDIPALDELIPASVRALSRGHYGPEQIESAVRHLFGVDTQLIADRTYYVVEVGAILAGCGGWSRRRTLYGGDQTKSAEDPLLDPAREAARIRAFFVHPSWARRGLGSLILRTCMREARAAGFRRLELVSTLPGVPLYQAFGFVAHERFDAPLADGAVLPVVRMTRSLESD